MAKDDEGRARPRVVAEHRDRKLVADLAEDLVAHRDRYPHEFLDDRRRRAAGREEQGGGGGQDSGVAHAVSSVAGARAGRDAQAPARARLRARHPRKRSASGASTAWRRPVGASPTAFSAMARPRSTWRAP